MFGNPDFPGIICPKKVAKAIENKETCERMSQFIAMHYEEFKRVLFSTDPIIQKKPEDPSKPSHYMLMTMMGSAFFCTAEEFGKADRETMPGFIGIRMLRMCESDKHDNKFPQFINIDKIMAFRPLDQEDFEAFKDED